MKQTAVEWLFDRLQSEPFLTHEDFQQAKEMERQQIIFFANFCRVFDVKNPDEIISVVELLDKYNTIYKK
jgi:hypothetical protein